MSSVTSNEGNEAVVVGQQTTRYTDSKGAADQFSNIDSLQRDGDEDWWALEEKDLNIYLLSLSV